MMYFTSSGVSFMSDDTTVVLFRRFLGSRDIVALFPYGLGTHNPETCASYMHVGQHGSAEPYHTRRITAPAKPEEYRALADELISIGYRLDIRTRIPGDAYAVRTRKLSRYS
jgi:hypothetical protein